MTSAMNRQSMITGYIFGIFCAAGIIGAAYLLYPDAIGCSDDFYHTRIAVQGWNTYTAKTFPANTMSIWEKNFADKELGFHVLLDILNRINSALGLPEYPFTFCRLCFIAVLLSAFSAALIHFRVSAGFLFLPLLFLLDPYFTQRMLQLRPQVLSAALMLIGTVIFLRAESRKGFIAVFLLCLIYGWSYSNPHFILFPLGTFAFAHFLHDKKRGVRLFCCGFAGLLASLIIHPQFPNNLTLWYVQCVLVVREMIHPAGIILGVEMMRRGFKLYGIFAGLSVLAAANAAWSVFMIFRNGRRFFTAENTAVLIMAGISFAGIYFSLRMIEYALPFNLLYSGMLLEQSGAVKHEKTVLAGFAIAILLTILHVVWDDRDFRRGFGNYDLQAESNFIRNNLPPGTVIGNLNWQDFPMLYYHLPEYRTLFGLEPFFCYSVYPERYLKYQRYFQDDFYELSPEELKEVTGTDIILASDTSVCEKILKIPGIEIMYDNGSRIIAKLR